jgi:broad specificity phosphatase PhoE
MRLVLCRHAEPDTAANPGVLGQFDVGLSLLGEDQADRLAAALAAEEPSALYSSPLRRAWETAERIGSRLGLEPNLDERLREIDFGDADGLTWADVEARWPEVWQTRMKAPGDLRFPGGESLADLKLRAVAAVRDIVAAQDGAAVVVVAHAGVIRALFVDWLSMPDDALFRIDQDHASVNVVEVIEGTVNVRLVNGLAAALASE